MKELDCGSTEDRSVLGLLKEGRQIMPQWYFHDGHTQQGPMSEADLKRIRVSLHSRHAIFATRSMNEVSISKFGRNLRSWLRRIREGERIALTLRSKAVAELARPDGTGAALVDSTSAVDSMRAMPKVRLPENEQVADWIASGRQSTARSSST
jgi:antitoxin (DNA-binding transcriptional repressor) of toxin-antitoxin stability system